ncbi:hypothetical protein [Leucobacter chromiireducens]|uniref:Uncharacterized protein n=1 Tax=Leucobacter chromiireducens subsp. solipictus TaxID=398235 RepID=A0ABS1SBJ5_9MICO|nr:hypothetical protein [Leucobacter chromiireducens]MBL3677914.1 hypothetical protein [Leucobacter chromiireducens subsp. solipictus]
MTSRRQDATRDSPEHLGNAARAIAFFPLLMSVYAVFYAAWWPFAWGFWGAGAFLVAALLALAFAVRGIAQMQHSARFAPPTDGPSDPENQRRTTAITRINSIAHPVWILGSIVLLALGRGRWVLPLMVVVIGLHFIPMARIMDRRIDYVLGPGSALFGVAAALLAQDPTVPWLTVFGVAGVGGALATLTYAWALARDYRRLSVRAGLPFPDAAET